MRVAHIVPVLSIGGVEVAIDRSFSSLNEQPFEYRVYYVLRKGSLDVGQRHIFSLFAEVLRRRWRPNVVITSLWWAHPFGVLAKLLRIRWAAFSHSTNFSHIVDRLVIGWAWRCADFRLVDSNTTHLAMCKIASARPSMTVPYLFKSESWSRCWRSRSTDFVWIGRAAKVKRVDLLVSFMKVLEHLQWHANISILIAGDVPEDLFAYAAITKHRLSIRVDVPNAEVREQLTRSRFFLLFSDYEGMSMSTLEAMQCGAIPIVRPVGEIPAYLSEAGGIFIKSIDERGLAAAARSASCLVDALKFSVAEEMQRTCLNAVDEIPGYTETLKLALTEMALG